MPDRYSYEAAARIYTSDEDRDKAILAEQDRIIDELVNAQTRSLAHSAESHAREHRLIAMVEERDRQIDNLQRVIRELRGRIALLDMPNGSMEVF